MSDELINESISFYLKHVKKLSEVEMECKNKFEILKCGTRISFLFEKNKNDLPSMSFSLIFSDKHDITKWDKIFEHIRSKLD